MRVLHWFANYLHGGGVANAVTALAHAQADAGLEVAVAGAVDGTSPLYGEHSPHTGVEVIGWHPSWTARLGRLVLRRPHARDVARLREWRPDIVHVHAEFAPDNVWAPRLFDCPLVLSFHGALHPEVFRKGKSAQKRLYVQVARRALYRRIDLFHALSPAEAAHIAAVLPGSATATIPFGPVVRLATPMSDPPSAARTPARGVRLLFLGRLDEYTKGLDLALSAFALARRSLGDELETTFHLVGPDWRGGKRSLEARAFDLQLGSSVVLPGAVPSTDVGRCLAEADLYIQLSRHDAFPLSVIDALLAGMPAVLSSAIGTVSYPEIASLAQIRVVDPEPAAAAAALVDLVRRLPDVTESARRSQDELRTFFSWKRIVAEFLRSYESLHARAS